MNYKKHYQSALIALMLYQIAILIDDKPPFVLFANTIGLLINIYALTQTFES